eukprot:7576291-Alexandrium_andersonii.AAC.1
MVVRDSVAIGHRIGGHEVMKAVVIGPCSGCGSREWWSWGHDRCGHGVTESACGGRGSQE